MNAGTSPDLVTVYASHASFVRRQLARRGVLPADLDDLVHDAFITIQRILPSFEGRSSLETWLRSVTWRVAADYHRYRRRCDSSAQLEQLAEETAPLLEVERFHASFIGLDDEQRDLLALHEIGGLSISSIADLEGNARTTIRRRIERGKNAVQRALRANAAVTKRDAWYRELAARFARPPGLRQPVMRVLPCGQTCISTLDDIVLAVWRGPASPEALHLLIEVMTAHLEAWPDGIRYLSIMEQTSTPPTREGRSLMVWLARELGPRVKAAATIVESEELMALSASVFNACLFLARSPMNLRFFRDVATGMPWIAHHGGAEIAEAPDHIQRMRAALDRHQGKPALMDEQSLPCEDFFEAAQ